MIQYLSPNDSRFTERACPVCHCREFKRVFIKRGFQYCRCHQCGMVYINPIPDQESLKRVYDWLGHDWFALPRKVKIDYQPGRFDRELGVLKRTGARGRLLDVGCSTGAFLIEAAKAGFADAQGIDISEPSIEIAREYGLNAVTGDFASDAYPAESFEVVTMWATLEHLPNPSHFVAQAYRVLRKGGIFAASVPNFKSISHLLLGPKYRYVGIGHLNYFSEEPLRRLFVSAGFQVLETETRSINPFVIWEDSCGKELQLEDQFQETERSIRLKSKSWYAPTKLAYFFADRLVKGIGRGDLLLIVGRK